jgi:hypothetical protein
MRAPVGILLGGLSGSGQRSFQQLATHRSHENKELAYGILGGKVAKLGTAIRRCSSRGLIHLDAAVIGRSSLPVDAALFILWTQSARLQPPNTALRCSRTATSLGGSGQEIRLTFVWKRSSGAEKKLLKSAFSPDLPVPAAHFRIFTIQ